MTQNSAEQDAEGAARRAKITIRELESPSDLRTVAELVSLIWDSPLLPPIPHDVMRSLVHAGGCVHAAFRGRELVGASVAIFGSPAQAACYSLITGVSPAAEGQGIGLALKLAQRAWALQSGASTMTWTFDPLLRRNAYFNITRLGAVVAEYLIDFYGEIPDGVNDPETDRLAVTWDLRKPLPGSAETSAPPGDPVLARDDMTATILFSGLNGEPVLPPLRAAAAGPRVDWAEGGHPDSAAKLEATDGGSAQLRCWIPEDILSARRINPQLAGRWRLAMREALGGALGDGYEITRLMDPGWYVLEKERTAR
jgi:predicted GNAT superfamily acetyltransferase